MNLKRLVEWANRNADGLRALGLFSAGTAVLLYALFVIVFDTLRAIGPPLM